MLETLFQIPGQIGGVPVFGFGLLLAVWAIGSVALLGYLAWRQGFNADTLSYVPLLLVLGAVIAWVLPALGGGQGLPIHGYGVMLLLAVLASTWLATVLGRKIGLHPDAVISLTFWLFVPGIIGARLFYVTEYWSDFQRDTPLETLWAVVNVSSGGLVVYGSYLGAIVGIVAFARVNRLPLLMLFDLLAPCMMLGLAIGRIGCMLHGCCYGGPCHVPWAVEFPAQSPPYQSQVERGQMYGFELRGDPQGRPWIKRVFDDTPAARQGLRAGDIVTAINGAEVGSAAKAHELLRDAFRSGDQLRLKLGPDRELTLAAIDPPPRSLPVHPTQIYGAINGLVLCLLLLAYAPLRQRDGELIALMITVYPVTRFLQEIIRNDEGSILGTGMTISQNVSVLLFLAGVALWIYVLRQPRGVSSAELVTA